LSIFRFIGEIFRRFPALLLATIALTVMAGLVESASIVSLAPVIDILMNPDLKSASEITRKISGILGSLGFNTDLLTVTILFLIFSICKSAFTILSRYVLARAKYAVERSLTVETFGSFFNARWYFFSTNDQGKLLNTLTRQVERAGYAVLSLGSLFASSMQLIFCLGITFYISFQVTSLCLVTGALFTAPFALADKASRRSGHRVVASLNDLTSILHESLGMAKLVLGFGNSDKSVRAVDKVFGPYSDASVRSMTLTATVYNLFQPIGFLVVIFGLFAALKLQLQLSEIGVLLYGLFRATNPLTSFLGERNGLINNLPSYEQIVALSHSADEMRQVSGSKLFTSFERALKVENLWITYPGRSPVVRDVTVIIAKGKMTALVGPSGAGKTTLVDAIMAFNQPTAGRIMLDGIPLSEFQINSYRGRIGYVPQDSSLFNMTIRENLLWANENASEEEINRACRQANAAEFIDKLPQRYDTRVGDRGVRLSGGQVQRVALARAMLRNPELLILDEATSSLDGESERLIQKAIESIAKETTVVVVAHRLATIAKADYIYVMEDGGVVEEGSYVDLVRAGGKFNRMVEVQKLEVVN
jgi:ABC-type multidrug transport system fused ATPase/permease subunit